MNCIGTAFINTVEGPLSYRDKIWSFLEICLFGILMMLDYWRDYDDDDDTDDGRCVRGIDYSDSSMQINTVYWYHILTILYMCITISKFIFLAHLAKMIQDRTMVTLRMHYRKSYDL